MRHIGDTLATGQAEGKKAPLPVRPIGLTGQNAGAMSLFCGGGRLLVVVVQRILRSMTEPRRLYEQIAQKLAKAIADGEYELGQRLPSERELAHAFGVSRPTVREAIIALELDGLVDVRGTVGINLNVDRGHRDRRAF